MGTAADIADDSALWFIRLRWCAAAAQLALLAVAGGIFHHELPLGVLFAVAAATALSNVAIQRRFRTRRRLGRNVLEWTLIADALLLTAILFFTGGAANPFSIVYLVHIILAAVVLGERWTWIMTVVSIALYGVLFFSDGGSHAAHLHSGSYSSHLEGMWIAFAMTAMLLAFFVNRILMALRRRDDEAAELKLRAARSEQFAALVNLAAGAAHELATPLATIAIAAEELRRGFSANRSGTEQAADAELISAEIGRCKTILEAMGGQSGDLRGEMPSTFLLGDLRSDLASEMAALGVPTDSLLPELSDATLTLPRELLRKSLLNLIRNSADADPLKRIRLDADVRDDVVEFRVTDEGCGISPEMLHRLGEPFLTTKLPGKGMGLGVFLVKIFAERMGGELNYQRQAPSGTVARLSLPIACRP